LTRPHSQRAATPTTPRSAPALTWDRVNDPVVSSIIASFTDLVLFVDIDGTIADVSVGNGLETHPGWRKLVGKQWVDTLKIDSRGKVELLLREAVSGHTSRSREMNMKVDGLGEIPFRFTASRLDDRRVVAFGLDMRAIADLQQRMVGVQQSMELENERVRQSEAQYRVLFHVCSEGVLIARGARYTIVDANPAAAALLGTTPGALADKPLQELFEPESHEVLSAMLVSLTAGKSFEARLRPRGQADVEVQASANMFRQSGAVVLLFRFWPVGEAPTTSARDSRVLKVLEAMPDSFVVTDEKLRILGANASFCELVQQASEAQVIGQPIDRWLGRPGVDLNIIVSALREHGVIRNFSTLVRGDFGSEQGATLTAVTALDGKIPCFGFSIRPMTLHVIESNHGFGNRSAAQLQELVGRISLKEIVQETADLIERLCIEAALDISRNNRAAAAHLLGLSRQSLYTKLRRYGLEDFRESSERE
jgi:transcriptional regulator PpsR